MAIYQPVNIPGAVTDVTMNSWLWQAELYSEYLPLLPVNPFQVIKEYDQKKDKSCVVFSAGGMITGNTGLAFTDDELREIWQEYQGDQGGSIFKTTKQMGQRFMLECFPIDAWSKNLDIVLNKGWRVQTSIWCGPDLLIDGANDGYMNGDYTPISQVEEKFNMMVLKHAIIIWRDLNTYRTYFQNTWPNGAPKNIYDCTEVLQQLIDKKIIRQCAMLALPYSQDRKPGIASTIKSYTKALARIGISGATDIFQTYKNKYAKVDGVIDPQYRIK
jgi:hypothetical protein